MILSHKIRLKRASASTTAKFIHVAMRKVFAFVISLLSFLLHSALAKDRRRFYNVHRLNSLWMKEEKTKFETLDNDFLMNDVNNLLLWLRAGCLHLSPNICIITKQKTHHNQRFKNNSTKGIRQTVKSCIMCWLMLFTFHIFYTAVWRLRDCSRESMNGALKIVTHISYAKHEIDSVGIRQTKRNTNFPFRFKHRTYDRIHYSIRDVSRKKHAEIFRCSGDDIVVRWKWNCWADYSMALLRLIQKLVFFT